MKPHRKVHLDWYLLTLEKIRKESSMMTDSKEKDIINRLRLLEKQIKELKAKFKKEKDLLLDKYLKVQGFK